MTNLHFHLSGPNGKSMPDDEGTEIDQGQYAELRYAAEAHARQTIRECIYAGNGAENWDGWTCDVEDDDQKTVIQVDFAEVIADMTAA